MPEKKISERERNCVAECIFKHWGAQSETKPEDRVESYEQCLTECQIC